MNNKSVFWPFFPHENQAFGTHGNILAFGRSDDVRAMSLKRQNHLILMSRNSLSWMTKRFFQRVGRNKYLVGKEQVGRRILSLINTPNILMCHLLSFSGYPSIKFLATSSDMKQLFNSWSHKERCNPHSSYSVIQLALSDIVSHFHCLSLFFYGF